MQKHFLRLFCFCLLSSLSGCCQLGILFSNTSCAVEKCAYNECVKVLSSLLVYLLVSRTLHLPLFTDGCPQFYRSIQRISYNLLLLGQANSSTIMSQLSWLICHLVFLCWVWGCGGGGVRVLLGGIKDFAFTCHESHESISVQHIIII